MKRFAIFANPRLFLAVAGLSLVTGPGVCPAQNSTGNASPTSFGSTPRASRGVRILQVGNKDLASLREESTLSEADAISLGVSSAKLKADAASWRAISGWVKSGGVVFLHTDAAQLFGFRTIAARSGTNRMAGQLFGRAGSALPIAAHPLLLSGIPTRS